MAWWILPIALNFPSLQIYLIPGQCISSTKCTQDTDIRYHATTGRPLGAKWGPELETTTTGFNTPERKEECRDRCEMKCRGGVWPGCIAFSSKIVQSYSNQCNCYGYTFSPEFGTEVEVSKADYLSGRCVTGWFETDIM